MVVCTVSLWQFDCGLSSGKNYNVHPAILKPGKLGKHVREFLATDTLCRIRSLPCPFFVLLAQVSRAHTLRPVGSIYNERLEALRILDRLVYR